MTAPLDGEVVDVQGNLGEWMQVGAPLAHIVRTDKLRELMGWDPYNVTEDCDLGMRLHRHGWRTQVLDSTTWEEANSQAHRRARLLLR